MITIRNSIFFLLSILLTNCASNNVVNGIVYIDSSNCIKYNNNIDQNFEIYNDTIKKAYEDFKSSKYDIDIFLITSTYGYDVSHDCMRIYAHDKKVFFQLNNKIKKIPFQDFDAFWTTYRNFKAQNLSVDCNSFSSKQTTNVFFVKKDGKIDFSFTSNVDITRLNSEISINEINFIKNFILLSKKNSGF